MPEQFLIDHCSPTLAGLKPANMFPVSLEEQDIEEYKKVSTEYAKELGYEMDSGEDDVQQTEES